MLAASAPALRVGTATRVCRVTMTWPDLLGSLVRRVDQPAEAVGWALRQILAGEATSAQVAAFVTALRSKGETVTELTGMVEVMLEFATPITVPVPAVDVVGSGGDRMNTVNVSTMAAIVAAAAGATVVKHGNRAASSACGAADVLEALGIVLDLAPEDQQQVIAEVGIGFLFAPHYHPALRHAGPTRRELGIPTTFNLLGPLANPAQPRAQAVGVADPQMAELMAEVFAARGHQGLVVHGGDGLDELTTTTCSTLWAYADGELRRTELDPTDLGLPRAELAELVGGDPSHNAQVVRDVVAGVRGPVRDIVLLNAAAALVADAKPDADRLLDAFATQLERARTAIDSGAAEAKLEQWVSATQAVRV
jgi:anthranilate phosphoribosyltransferase